MRAPSPEARGGDDAPRMYRGPTAIRDEPGRAAIWLPPQPEGSAPNQPEGSVEVAENQPEGSVEVAAAADVTASPPPPSSVRDVPVHLVVAVGLAPEAPGGRQEQELLDAVEAALAASVDPTTDIRRLRPGAGTPRRICRERRDDLVVMIGYVADRDDPVVLAHDCRLDHALSVRGADAARRPELASALWREHLELQRAGLRERRTFSLGPKTRRGIIGGVAIALVGVAVGVLVANALREESVVITVRP